MTNSILARRTAALEEDRQDMPPPCIDWVGAVAPDGATIDASSSAPLLLSHHPDWASWLSTLDSRPPPAILILADPPPADAAMFLDWLAERGVVIGITSGLARELQPPPSWMRDIRLLVTDHRPVQIDALAPSARIDWLGEGPPPTVPNDCHAEPATDLMQVLRRARLRLRAQWAVDRWHTEQLAAERPFASIEPLARAPGSAPSTSTPMPPRRNWRSQLFERAVRLAQQPVIGPPLRWLWAITQSTHTYHGILRVQPQLQQLLGEQIQLLQQGHHQQLQLDQLSQQLQERLADIDQRLIQDAERQLQMNQLVQQLGNEQTAVLGLLRQLEQTQERLQGQIEQQAHTLQQQEERQAQRE
jgi:hypothetical protein